MKSLVVYDSSFGNTKKIAESIGDALGSKVLNVKDFKKEDLDGIKLIIVGSPINGWMPLPSIVKFIKSFGLGGLKNIKATAFDTRVKLFIHGDAKEKIMKGLSSAGAEKLISPEAFYVSGQQGPLLDGEVGKAAEWAKQIDNKIS